MSNHTTETTEAMKAAARARRAIELSPRGPLDGPSREAKNR